ncbi:uncharacterized protein LOC133514963 isoform X2 [Syngnathoides biaculeatus]|uniref:uncharacterized protein LOC133514963 isoform X2 n=1 Tax=Syngnathoides biaculeatus TaxID=300417 RepID=UPI002ADE64D1|nr:uncharacterized protein LOC133514963 isoform X2 [Syngnathoides biaculeatus]
MNKRHKLTWGTPALWNDSAEDNGVKIPAAVVSTVYVESFTNSSQKTFNPGCQSLRFWMGFAVRAYSGFSTSNCTKHAVTGPCFVHWGPFKLEVCQRGHTSRSCFCSLHTSPTRFLEARSGAQGMRGELRGVSLACPHLIQQEASLRRNVPLGRLQTRWVETRKDPSGRAGACPTHHRAKGGLHPELVAGQSQGRFRSHAARTKGRQSSRGSG